MDERDVRAEFLRAAAAHSELSTEAEDVPRDEVPLHAKAHAESARALVEASTYLIPAPEAPSLSDDARTALRELLQENGDAYPGWSSHVRDELNRLGYS